MVNRIVRRSGVVIRKSQPVKPTRHSELQPLAAFMISQRCPRNSMVEVGTNAGDAVFLWRELFRRVAAVDAWTPDAYVGSDAVHDGISKRSKAKFNEVERIFDRRFGDDTHVTKVKTLSCDAAKDWEVPVDFVYIDAAHDYANVKADILAWMPHCKRWIGGHDYHEEVWPGVFQAVNETLGVPDAVFVDTSWVFDLERIRSASADSD